MSSITDFPARGRITAVADGKVTFQPSNTNYELSLAVAKDFAGTVGSLVDGVIRVAARKLYTVPSGGNFVSPIFGPPRTIQGRVKFVDSKTLVVQAGVPIAVDLPADDNALDLHEGGIGVGTLVNVVGLPGARFELVCVAAGQN
jgi:hypothetical protein